MDDEEAQFTQNFSKFPSSFSLKIEELSKSKHVESNKKKLERKCEANEFESLMERTRIYNMLSFLHWKAEERDKAYDFNRQVLELDNENIVALCNRVWMKWEDGHLTDAIEDLNRVKTLAESKTHLVMQGEAEMAYSYSVFGPRYFSQSINMIKTVLRDKGNEDVDAAAERLWKFDLGIIYRKVCNFGNRMPNRGCEEININESISCAALLLYDIASSNSPRRWRGRCWASLAELSYSIRTGTGITKPQQELFPEGIINIGTERLLNLALETSGEDSHVLKVCGKHFKYIGKIDRAKEVLLKSLQLRETPHAHFHLALVLKNKLKENNWRLRYGSNRTRGSICREGYLHYENPQQDNDKQIPNQSSTPRPNNSSQHFSPRKFANQEGFMKPGYKDSDRSRQNQIPTPSFEFDEAKLPSIPARSQQQMKALVKGFDRVFTIPNTENEAVKEILFHLDKAIEGGNAWALVEKGLLFRQIKDHEKAFQTFLTGSQLKECSTAMTTISCYEHLGACCRDLSEEETDPEKKRKLENDAVLYWKTAIKSLAYIASQELKDTYMAYPSIKKMFRTQKANVNELKSLAKLSQMLERHGEALEFYDQITKLDEEQAKDPDIICGMVEIYRKQKRMEEATILLDMQRCTEGKDKVSKELYKLVYLEYAFHLFKTGKEGEARERCRQAFAIDYTDHFKRDTDIDLFLLYDGESKKGDRSPAFSLARRLVDILKEYGLRINDCEDVPGNKEGFKEETKQINSSKHIVLVLDRNEDPDPYIGRLIEVSHDNDTNKISKLSLIIIDESTCPSDLTLFPKIRFETKLLDCEDGFRCWIQTFILHLLGFNENKDSMREQERMSK